MAGRPLLDLGRDDDAHTSSRLSTELVIWFGSTRPDGRPHHVPVWFAWQDPLVAVFSMPSAVKVRNIQRQPEVVLTLDSRANGQDVVIVEGSAARVTTNDDQLAPLALRFAEKYRGMLPGPGLDEWNKVFSVAVVVTASRVVAWTRNGGALAYRSVP